MTRDTKHVVKAGRQSSTDPYTFILSDETEDRMGDVIRADGWKLDSFSANPVALFGHDHSFPIGVWKNVKVVGKQLRGTLELAAQGTSNRIDEIRSLIEQGILKAVSVGFRINEYEPMDKKDPYGGWNITGAELLETSVVSVPANPSALSLAKSLGVSKGTIDLAFGRLSAGRTPPNRVKAVPVHKTSTPKGKPMKLGDKIVAAETALNDLRDQMSDIVKGAEDAGRDFMDEENAEIEQLSDDIKSAEGTLNSLKTAEASLATRSATQQRQKVGIPVAASVAAKEEPGAILFKALHVQLRAHKEKRSVEDVVSERYSHDERVKAVLPMLSVNKAATTVADTVTSGWAAELVDTARADFLHSLEPVSIYARLSGAGFAIPFDGQEAVTIPSRTLANSVAGSFVQQGGSIPVKQDQYGSQTINRYKMGVITAWTNELARTSNPGVEGLLRRAIMEDTARAVDAVFMDPAFAAVAAVNPASPWAGADTQASAGVDQASILTDLRFLIDTLTASNAGRNPYIVMNTSRILGLTLLTNANGAFVFRNEIANGTLLGVPLIVSNNCPSDQVYIMDAADFATASDAPMFDVSEQATLVMADDSGVAPTMVETGAVTAAGSLHVSDAAGTTPPTVVRSMYQTYSTAIRMVWPTSWAMIRTGSVAYLTGVAW